MGYILPVGRFQYNDYHLRTINEKKDTVFIERPFKTVLEERHEEISSEYERLNSGFYRIQKERQQLNQRDGSIVAELTGKGTMFNEYI